MVFFGRVAVRDAHLVVVDGPPPTDALAASVVHQLAVERRHRQVRDWLMFLATSAEEAVGRRLAHLGHVHRLERVTLLRRRQVSWVPASMNIAAWPGVRLHRAAADPRQPLSQHDAVLAGLVLATGLDQHVLWNLDPPARDRLLIQLRRLDPSLRDLVALTETAVGEAVLSHRT